MRCFILVGFAILGLVTNARVSAQDLTASSLGDGILTQLNSPDPDNDIEWNNIADFILEALQEDVQKNNEEQLPIPDIDEGFTTKVAFFKVTGNFAAQEGYFRNLATLHRTDDVTITKVDNVYTLSCALGFREVNIGYGHYLITVKRLKQSVSGSISGSIGKNSIALKVDVDMGEGQMCKATLREVRVVELEDLSLRLTGFGVLNGLASKLANDAVQNRKGDIVTKIETALRRDATEALKKVTCNL